MHNAVTLQLLLLCDTITIKIDIHSKCPYAPQIAAFLDISSRTSRHFMVRRRRDGTRKSYPDMNRTGM